MTSKAINHSTDRRSFIKGASLVTIAAAIPATIATAIGATPALAEAAGECSPAVAAAPDPIFALIAERDRLSVLARAADARRIEIERPAGPVADFRRPEFAPMAKGNTYDAAKDGEEITREYLEDYNRRAEAWALARDFDFMWDAVTEAGNLRRVDKVAAGNVFIAAGERLKALRAPSRTAKAKRWKAQRDGKARLAWWDAEHARLKPALDAYELHRPAAEAADEEHEENWSRVDDITAEILTTPPVTLAGAMAQLGEAVRQIEVDHSDNDGNVDREAFNLEDRAVINVYASLVRLLPGSAVAS